MNKITVIGAGRVGESTAQFIASRDLCRELCLIDIREGAAEGAALDIQQNAPIFRFDTRLTGGTDYALMADSDLLIITAGVPRKPGMSRSDVLEINVQVTDQIVQNALLYAPTARCCLSPTRWTFSPTAPGRKPAGSVTALWARQGYSTRPAWRALLPWKPAIPHST